MKPDCRKCVHAEINPSFMTIDQMFRCGATKEFIQWRSPETCEHFEPMKKAEEAEE